MKKLVIFFVAFCSFLVFTNSVQASTTPKEYAEGIANKVVTIVESQMTETAKERRLIDLFKSNVDSDWMGKFTMGRFFRQAEPAQQRKYLGLYRDYVIYSYIPKFRLYTGERMQVNQVIDDTDGFYTVKTTLNTSASSTGKVFVDYKLKKAGGTYKIVDVIGEGVSLINTQRSDFIAPLTQMGIEGFINRLEEKVKALKSNPPKDIESAAAKN